MPVHIFTKFIEGFFRIIYLGRLCQKYIASANSELQKMYKVSPAKQSKDKLTFQQNSIKMAENILKLAVIFIRQPQSFAFVMTPSWKTENRYIFCNNLLKQFCFPVYKLPDLFQKAGL